MAFVPLWQLAQDPVTEPWSKRTVVQAELTWQLSQAAEVATWPLGLPLAVVPLWQLAHVPVTEPWSNFTVVQLLLT